MTEKLLIGILNFNPSKQTIVGILTFLSMKTSFIITISVSSFNFSLNRVEHLKCFITLGPGFVICCFSCFELQPQLTELLQTAEGLKEVGTVSALKPYEPPHGKTNNVVSEQVRHKPTCTSTEKS